MADVNQVFSSASSISQKVGLSSALDKIQSGIKTLSSTLSAGLSSSPLSLLSSFENKDFQSVAGSLSAENFSPEETRKLANKYTGSLVYPVNLKYFTKFQFVEHNKLTPFETTKKLPTVDIILPMPSNLQETFQVNYETPALGPIAGTVAESALNELRNRGGTGASPEEAQKQVGATVAQALGAVAGDVIKKAAGETAENITKLATGLAPNPHLATIFKDVNLRTHSFSYRFSPSNESELSELKQIVKELKQRMLPGYAKGGNVLFTFPHTCFITFGPEQNKPYKIKECVMESLSVNYSPNGPVFFKTGDPVFVEIQMSFKEIKVFTREDVEDDEPLLGPF